MTNDSSRIRTILRQAERALDDPAAARALAEEGISVGDFEEVDKEAFLADLDEDAEASPSVDITVYFDETPVKDREEIEGPLSEYVESSGLGAWVGSGEGSVAERRFFDIAYTVHDLSQAIPLIKRRLQELGSGPGTQIEASDGTVQDLG